MDFYAEFIFVTGAHQKEIPEMILGLVPNRKNSQFWCKIANVNSAKIPSATSSPQKCLPLRYIGLNF